jgi:hypothetical protein
MNKRVIAILAAITLTATMLAGCGKSVSIEETGAKCVPGVSNLCYFCIEETQTLVYFSKWSDRSDEYEWFYPGGCQKGVATIPLPNASIPNGDSTESDK